MKQPIQLITREKEPEFPEVGFGIGLRNLLKDNPVPELKEGKNGYLKASLIQGKVFFDFNPKPIKGYGIYKITHLEGNDHSYRKFIEQDESKLLKFVKENNISIMSFPGWDESLKNSTDKITNLFERRNPKKIEDWYWEKGTLNKNKISMRTKEILEAWNDESVKKLAENPGQKTIEIPTEIIIKPWEHLGMNEWALTLLSHKLLRGFHELVYSKKEYRDFYKFFKQFIKELVDSPIEIGGKNGVRVYGHNGLYFYEFYQDALGGDFCKKCGKFLKTGLTPNGLIRKNRRVFCDKLDNFDCYKSRKAENQKRWIAKNGE